MGPAKQSEEEHHDDVDRLPTSLVQLVSTSTKWSPRSAVAAASAARSGEPRQSKNYHRRRQRCAAQGRGAAQQRCLHTAKGDNKEGACCSSIERHH